MLGPSACSSKSATLSSDKPGRSWPRSRATTLNGLRDGALRRVARPRRRMSLTVSRKDRPDRRVSAFSLAATSSSRVRVVLMQ